MDAKHLRDARRKFKQSNQAVQLSTALYYTFDLPDRKQSYILGKDLLG
jgi:hypothetical protein